MQAVVQFHPEQVKSCTAWTYITFIEIGKPCVKDYFESFSYYADLEHVSVSQNMQPGILRTAVQFHDVDMQRVIESLGKLLQPWSKG